jgi:hypothetical protein
MSAHNPALFRGSLERNQGKRALTNSLEGDFCFYPTDEGLSVETPVRNKPLGGLAFGVQLLWFRYSLTQNR